MSSEFIDIQKEKARSLYLSGMGLNVIAEHLGLPFHQIRNWIYRGAWRNKMGDPQALELTEADRLILQKASKASSDKRKSAPEKVAAENIRAARISAGIRGPVTVQDVNQLALMIAWRVMMEFIEHKDGKMEFSKESAAILGKVLEKSWPKEEGLKDKPAAKSKEKAPDHHAETSGGTCRREYYPCPFNATATGNFASKPILPLAGSNPGPAIGKDHRGDRAADTELLDESPTE